MATKSLEELVPKKLHKCLSVFSDEEASQMPQHDHKIELKKDFTAAQKTAPMFEHISNFQLLCDHDISCCNKKY